MAALLGWLVVALALATRLFIARAAWRFWASMRTGPQLSRRYGSRAQMAGSI